MIRPTHRWRAALLGASATMIALGVAGAASNHGPAFLLTGVAADSQQDPTVNGRSDGESGSQHQATSAPSPSASAGPTAPETQNDQQGPTDETGPDEAQGDQNDGSFQTGHADTGPNADHQYQGNE